MKSLTNLLPSQRVHAATREYYLRLLALTLSLGTLLILIHAALLTPSHLYLSEEVKTRTAHLADIASSAASSEGEGLRTRIEALSQRAAALLALTQGPSASTVVKEVLAVSRGGVRITALALSLPETGNGQLRLVGVAPTRESLQKYHAALQALPFVTKADLPLSVYAKERDLPFSITLTGPFLP